MSNQKNDTLELLKLFASYMVVFIHVIFSGKVGTIMETLARFAVPFFFLVSGFYSYQISTEKIKKRIEKIIALIIFAVISYTLFNVLIMTLNDGVNGILAYFVQYVDLYTLVKLFVFNVPICSEYLWYLYAILYVYVVFYLVTVLKIKEKAIFIISFSILLLNILLGEVLSFLGVFLPGIIVRNFAVMGIPFFALGLFVKKYQHKFFSIDDNIILLFFVIGILESIVSRYFFEKKEVYIGSLFILFSLVCLFIKYSNIKYPKFLKSLEGCSTYIYIFHDMISKTLRATYTVFGIDMTSSVLIENLHPIIVCICSTVFAYLLVKINTSKKRKSV